jgi:hypothetical protein
MLNVDLNVQLKVFVSCALLLKSTWAMAVELFTFTWIVLLAFESNEFAKFHYNYRQSWCSIRVWLKLHDLFNFLKLF